MRPLAPSPAELDRLGREVIALQYINRERADDHTGTAGADREDDNPESWPIGHALVPDYGMVITLLHKLPLLYHVPPSCSSKH